MKNILDKPRLKAQNSRNGFDVSYQNQFTAPFGTILPVGFWKVNPNDTFRFGNESQVICDGLVRPAFMRLKEHLDYYFIPATQLWMPFDNFITSQDSYFSSAIQNIMSAHRTPDTVPFFSGDFLVNILEAFSQNQTKDELGYSVLDGSVRLLDHCGYFNLNQLNYHQAIDAQTMMDFGQAPYMNFFRLLCYQKVYFDYFRNPLYEDNNVFAYNIDDIGYGKQADAYNSRFDPIFRLRYRWAKKDYFTQVRPNVLANSSLLGFSGMVDYAQNQVGSGFRGVFGVPGAVGESQTAGSTKSATISGSTTALNDVSLGTVVGHYTSSSHTPSQGLFSVANIRFAFAYDKLLRRMREAGQDFDKQMLAQFGIAPVDKRHGKCTYIGGFTNSLKSSDVTNMTGANIGELAGTINTYSQNVNKPLKFHAQEHGYIIAVWSTSCENTYQSFKTDRDNTLVSRFDWFNPVFENLGLQPLFRYEMDYTDPSQPVSTRGGSYWRDYTQNIMGYVPRYSEYKTRVDEVHGPLCRFCDTAPMYAWNMQYYRRSFDSGLVNANTALDMRDLLLDPCMMDNVSGVNYNGLTTTDHFVVNMYHHAHVVSSMSSYGETF